MPTLPADIIPLLMPFMPLFTKPAFQHIQVLLMGAILSPGKRTVTAALRAVGCEKDKQFQKYHRVLNRDRWSSRKTARVLLELLIAAFAPSGELVFGIDETLERRWGKKIAARGIYRDAARSTKEYVVKASGLRWLSMMLLTEVPWAHRIWALPFFSVLAPSERYHEKRKKPHKKSTDWARQMIKQMRRWLPMRRLVFVMDGGYSALELLYAGISLLHPCTGQPNPVTLVTPLRLDAALYKPAPNEEQRREGKVGRQRSGRKPIKGERLPTLQQVINEPELLGKAELVNDPSIEWPTAWQRVTIESWYEKGEREVELLSGTCLWYHGGKEPVPIRYVVVRPTPECDPKDQFRTTALLCTDLDVAPKQILIWYMMRWEVEVTFQEVREHLGVETQRQWNDLAIARTTPALLGLYSLVTLMAKEMLALKPLSSWQSVCHQQSSWYHKQAPTFSDILALVRRHLWKHLYSKPIYSLTSSANSDKQNIEQVLLDTLDRLTNVLAYAA